MKTIHFEFIPFMLWKSKQILIFFYYDIKAHLMSYDIKIEDEFEGVITVKGTTQVNGHSLKLHFCMFEKSQGKYNSLDCHKFFWNIFH